MNSAATRSVGWPTPSAASVSDETVSVSSDPGGRSREQRRQSRRAILLKSVQELFEPQEQHFRRGERWTNREEEEGKRMRLAASRNWRVQVGVEIEILASRDGDRNGEDCVCSPSAEHDEAVDLGHHQFER